MKYLLESIDKRFKIAEEYDDEFEIDDNDALEEENTSDNVGAFDTPNAFGAKKRKKDSVYSEYVPETHNFYKKIAESIIESEVSNKNLLNELSYPAFKADDTKTERQKINLNIQEINRKLSEVERMINHASKLKMETGADNSVFWKGTIAGFTKINEKLIRLSGKIREMNA